jgi:GH25 family lysozyme M1 (1,4-beta-N-acetylmuramidase)
MLTGTRLFRLAFVSAALLAGGALSAGDADAYTCGTGPVVRTEADCPFFRVFRPLGDRVDARVRRELAVPETSPTIRSIALVIGVDQYPNFNDGNLPPAAKDVANLIAFLKDQQFDEVIVLTNKDASWDNISYFLEQYLPGRAAFFNGKARLLIAYSGHGAERDKESVLVLSDASSVDDRANTYQLSDLNDSLRDLSRLSFQVLALINACFGGDVFKSGNPGGNMYVTNQRGAHALTAGGPNDLVWALDENSGSIFFDSLIEGVTTGNADTSMQAISDGRGRRYLVPRTLIRLGRLEGYLTEKVEEIGTHPTTHARLATPYAGPINDGEPLPGAFFFLGPLGRSISPEAQAAYPDATPLEAGGSVIASVEGDQITLTAPLASQSASVTLSDASAEVSVFEEADSGVGLPDTGPADLPDAAFLPSLEDAALPPSPPPAAGPLTEVIHAATVSKPPAPDATTNEVELAELSDAADDPAPGASGNDLAFSLPSGPVSALPGNPAIKIFNPPEEYTFHGIDISQFNDVTWSKLPADVDFVYVRATGILGVDKKFRRNWAAAKEQGIARGTYHYWSYCQSVDRQFNKIVDAVPVDIEDMPIALDIDWPAKSFLSKEVACAKDLGAAGATKRIVELLDRLHRHYGKLPLVYGNANVFSDLLTEYTDFAVWLGKPEEGQGDAEVSLSGVQPWTIWQYTQTGKIQGVNGPVDRDVFFGTKEQFDAFVAGQSKVALEAASGRAN